MLPGNGQSLLNSVIRYGKASEMIGWKITKKAWSRFSNDNCPRMASALAYYAAFSLPSILLIVLFLGGLVFERAAVRRPNSAADRLYCRPKYCLHGPANNRKCIAAGEWRPYRNVLGIA